ncbi:MAG: hypothetical protein C4316_12070 [Chloroflexota bacterium]
MARFRTWLAPGTRLVILGLDRLLRRIYGIREFWTDPECILRIARERSPETVRLADGTLVVKGAPGIGLHFWNEHIPPIDPAGPDLAWGLKFYRRLRKSLQVLAGYLKNNNDLNDAVALWAEVSFPAEPGLGRYTRLLEAFGFEFKPLPPPEGILGRVGRFFQHLYAWALIWTFNPPSLRRKNLFAAERGRLWVSKAELLRRHLRQ